MIRLTSSDNCVISRSSYFEGIILGAKNVQSISMTLQFFQEKWPLCLVF